MKKSLLISSCLFLSLAASNASAQTTEWWDNNGASAATSGTWDTTSSFWSTTSALSASPTTFSSGNYAIFAAGTTTISALTITVSDAESCEGIGDGTTSTGTASGAPITTLTFSGAGSINLPAGTWPFECGIAGNNLSINLPIAGSGGIIQHGGGQLSLYGNNTYSGGTTATGGQIINYNNNNSFGTGPVNINTGGSTSLLNTSGSLLTLTNAFTINNGGNILNFGNGNTICSGPWTLQVTPQLKNNSGSAPLTISGVISGAFGIDLQCNNNPGALNTFSGANTYTGPTSIGAGAIGGTTILSVSSINSVTTPPQQSSSSLGVPSSVANGTIAIGATSYGCTLIYTGSGETSDRVINLTGTTGAATIEMDGTGPLILTSPVTVTTAGARTLTLQGTSSAANSISAIPDSSSGKTTLTKAQAGTWVLSGTNTFTGNTTISAGTLTIGGAGELGSTGSYAGTISDAGAFTYNSSANQTLTGVISGAGALTESGPGGLTLSAVNTRTGSTTITAGTLTISGSGVLGGSGGTYAGAIANSGTLVYKSSAAETFSGIVSGAGILTESGSGTLTLTGADTFTGPITITGGTLAIGGSGKLNGGTYANTISDAGTFTFNSSSAQTLSGTISGTGGVTESGSGALTLTAADTYTGTTTIGANSTLYLSGAGSINNSATLSIAAGGTFDVSALPSPYTVSSTSLIAAGSASAAATINGASGGVINLGSQPISLSFTPTSFTGDNSHPALSIPQSLQLSGNVITVSNATATPLGVGNYTLIQATGGTTGTPSQYVAVTGAGLAAGAYAAVQVSGGNVVLVVTQAATTNPTWNGNDYGTSPDWSDSLNWVSGVPDATGDQVIFDNTTGPQTPVMDSSYSVYSLTFASGCSSDVLAASGANSLTIGSAVTNASGVLQTIAMPVQLVDLGSPTVASAWNTGSGGITVSDPISDLGTGLTLSGTGPLTLTATNNYTGPTTIASGSTLSLGGSGALGVTATATNYTGNIAIASTGIFNYNSSAAQTLTGIVSGAGQLQQNGPGPLTLNTNDTFSGGLTIAPSTTLTISGTGGINNGAANLISDNGTFVYNSTANQTLTQIISGSGAVTLAGGGQTTTVTLAGRNTYTGITTIENCSLVITNDINLGTAPGSVVANQLTMNCAIVNGTNYLDYGLRFQTTSGAINANRGIYLGANGGSINVQNGVTLTNFEVISGPGAFYASPNASAGYGTILLSALNTYTGPTFIGAGNLNLGLSGALPTGTPLTIGSSFQGAANGSFFNMSGFSQTIGPLASSPGLGATGVGLPTVATGGGALTVFETNISTTFAGVITGAGSLTLTVPPGGTASELILSGTNTYTGATTINAGAELGLTANGAISNSASINIAAGGTFDVSGLTPTPFTLSASTALNASGIGTGSSAAAIKGASAGAVNLASRPINLTYTPAGTSGDATDPALYISQGALTLSGNLITVNNAGSTLGAGVYNLIQVAGGTINGVPSATANVTGAGIAAGATAAISVNGGNVILSVVSATPPTPTITGVSLNGTLLTITATNGAANGPYALLESTNVALPLTNWTVLMSNSFDASGNINFSTNITTNAHEFYIIQQP